MVKCFHLAYSGFWFDSQVCQKKKRKETDKDRDKTYIVLRGLNECEQTTCYGKCEHLNLDTRTHAELGTCISPCGPTLRLRLKQENPWKPEG